jgi:hypothetical protein
MDSLTKGGVRNQLHSSVVVQRKYLAIPHNQTYPNISLANEHTILTYLLRCCTCKRRFPGFGTKNITNQIQINSNDKDGSEVFYFL